MWKALVVSNVLAFILPVTFRNKGFFSHWVRLRKVTLQVHGCEWFRASPPPLRDLPSTLTWFARDWLDGQSQLGVRGDRERLVAWGEGWDHDIRHIDLLRAKKPRVSPPEAQTAGRPWTEGRRGGEAQGRGQGLASEGSI